MVEGPAGIVHVQVTVTGITGYLLAMTNPTSAVERFTGSFRQQP